MTILTESEWQCPVCMSTLYKPTAAACGHCFCFWCTHKSMSPFDASRCPLCRHAFGHFPDVCSVLHHFLLRAFPEQYAARAEETRETEAEEEVDSVEVQAPAAVAENPWAQAVPAADARWSMADFLCAAPGCARLLREPLVLNCGCCVCARCRPATGGGCPRCAAIAVTDPRPCFKLKDLVAELFPGEEYDAHWAAARQQAGEEPAASQQEEAQQQAQQEREEQQRQQGAKRKIARAGECNGRRSPTPPAAGEPAAEPAAAASAEGGAAAAGAGAEAPPGERNSAAAIQRRLAHTAAHFTHFGIGCDYCGAYPIVGERWQCLDCPERVGFDLCGACYAKRCNVTGRFNQHHTSDHRMQEVSVAPNLLHVLQAANPEMDMSQILGMLQMAWEADDGGAGGGDDANADPPIPHVHRGGPRPATSDPFAPGNLANAAFLTHPANADFLTHPAILVPVPLVPPPPPPPRPALHADASAAPSQPPAQAAVDALAAVDPAAAELQAVRARMLARSQPPSGAQQPRAGAPPPRVAAHVVAALQMLADGSGVSEEDLAEAGLHLQTHVDEQGQQRMSISIPALTSPMEAEAPAAGAVRQEAPTSAEPEQESAPMQMESAPIDAGHPGRAAAEHAQQAHEGTAEGAPASAGAAAGQQAEVLRAPAGEEPGWEML